MRFKVDLPEGMRNYLYTMKKKNAAEHKPADITSAALHEFTVNLRKAVSDTGLTPYALSKKLGLDKCAIKNITRDGHDPKLSTVLKIVKGMRLSLDWLLGFPCSVDVDKPVQFYPASSAEVAQDVRFIDKIAKMHEQDVELLNAIADVLNNRRVRSVLGLASAVYYPKPAKISVNDAEAESDAPALGKSGGTKFLDTFKDCFYDDDTFEGYGEDIDSDEDFEDFDDLDEEDDDFDFDFDEDV
jgi:transcriptional regulator with XRE-family HTH domain